MVSRPLDIAMVLYRSGTCTCNNALHTKNYTQKRSEESHIQLTATLWQAPATIRKYTSAIQSTSNKCPLLRLLNTKTRLFQLSGIHIYHSFSLLLQIRQQGFGILSTTLAALRSDDFIFSEKVLNFSHFILRNLFHLKC